MSYDLELLHARSALSVASVRFASATDLAGTAVIPAVTGAAAVVHAIYLQASAYFPVQLERTTAAASAYWIGFGNQTPTQENTRFQCDVSSAVFLSGTNGLGSGVVRIYYTYNRSTGNTST